MSSRAGWYKKTPKVLNCSETPARRMEIWWRLEDEKGRVYSSPARAWKLVPEREAKEPTD